MGTVPAPNIYEDASQIAQAPQNAMAEYARIAALKQQTAQTQQQMQQSQQLQPAKVQTANQDAASGALDLQQKQLQMQDQQTLRQLAPSFIQKDDSGKVTGFDVNGLAQAAQGKGVNPATTQALLQNYASTREKLAGATKAERENQDAINSQATDQIEGLKDIKDPQQRQQAYQAAVQHMQQHGLDVSAFPAQVPMSNDDLSHLEVPLGMHKQIIADAKTVSETAASNAKAELDRAEAAQKGSPLTMMETNPGEMAGDKLPAAMGYLQSKIADPTADPKDVARATRLLSTAKATQKAQLAMDASKKATDQAIADGDPVAAGKLLHDGVVAPSQIISSRKPEFAQKAFSAAAGYGDGWNAQKAEGDFKVAGSPTNVAFFGSAKSLTDKGGTLDQLNDAAKDIPGGQIPIFNKIEDVIKASTGSGPVAKYASILLGVADDYSKVMGGGQGSDTSRNAALSLAPVQASPEARKAAIEGIRGAVGSQINSRIGNNAVLKKMYGGESSSTSTSNTGNGQTATGPNGHKIVVKDGKWVDAQTGAPVQ